MYGGHFYTRDVLENGHGYKECNVNRILTGMLKRKHSKLIKGRERVYNFFYVTSHCIHK